MKSEKDRGLSPLEDVEKSTTLHTTSIHPAVADAVQAERLRECFTNENASNREVACDRVFATPAGAEISKEKQIEELARTMCRLSNNLKCRECSERCFFKDYAKKAIKAGWCKQVVGEWIGIEYDGYADGFPVYEVWECSSCGNEWRGDEPPCYCPDCGAKMKGGL